MEFLMTLSHNIWLEAGFLIGVMFLLNVVFLGSGSSFVIASFWIVLMEYFNAKKDLSFFQILDLPNSMLEPERLTMLKEFGVLLAVMFFLSLIARFTEDHNEEEDATGTGMNVFSLAFLFVLMDINFFNGALSAFFFLPFLGFLLYTEELTVRK